MNDHMRRQKMPKRAARFGAPAAAAAAAPAKHDGADADADGDGDGSGKEDDANVQVVQPFDGIRALCLSETLADVHFIVGKGGKTERIPAHRLVLSAANPVLRAMLYPLALSADGKTAHYSAAAPFKAPPIATAAAAASADVKAPGGPAGGAAGAAGAAAGGGAIGSGDEIVIADVSAAAFKQMLTAIYTDELEVTADDVTELIALAKRFGVDTLKALCVDFMERDVTADRACALFVDGRKLLNEPAFGLAFIEENTEDVCRSDGFTALPRDCLETILRSNRLTVDESELFAAVDRWAAAECKRQDKDLSGKREVLGDALALVRFPLIEMSDLVSKVQQSGVLSQDELLSLFTYASSPEGSKPAIRFDTRERSGGGSGKLVVEDFKWSVKLSNSARVRCEGHAVVSIAPTCNADVIAVADIKGWSSGVHYWRVNMAQGGCVRRVGLVDGEFPTAKYGGDSSWSNANPPILGSTPNSWGVSIDGNRYGEQNWFSGTAAGGGDIGLLLDCRAKKLYVFNGTTSQLVGCAFTNVKGKKLRPAVQICHSNSRAHCVLKAQTNAKNIVVPK